MSTMNWLYNRSQSITYIMGKQVGTQILIGYAGKSIILQYQAPEGYEIIDQIQVQITFTIAKQQIIQILGQSQLMIILEIKFFIRTNIHRSSGNIQTYRQMSILTWTVYVNAISEIKSYGELWQLQCMDIVMISMYLLLQLYSQLRASSIPTSHRQRY